MHRLCRTLAFLPSSGMKLCMQPNDGLSRTSANIINFSYDRDGLFILFQAGKTVQPSRGGYSKTATAWAVPVLALSVRTGFVSPTPWMSRIVAMTFPVVHALSDR